MKFDVSALKKYDVLGPRYTSYPTAPVFHEEFTSEHFIDELKQRDHQRDLSLYIHLPYCDTLCYFCGCNMKISNDREVISHYLSLLEKEMIHLKKFVQNARVKQLHWGGGTPTHLSPEQIISLGQLIKKHFDFSHDAECGVEIDPRGISQDTIAALKFVGFNRASMGIQDFDLKVQKAVNRVHSLDLISQVVSWIQDNQFESLNFDLIYGLPYQNAKTFSKTIDDCLTLSPNRFAVFNFAYLPHMIKHQKIIDPQTLPTPEEKLEIFEMTGNVLTDVGYVYVGMDHFATEDDSLVTAQRNKTLRRNFQGYSTHKDLDLIALGASGISQLDMCYSQNIKDIKAWSEAIESGQLCTTQRGWKLTTEDQLRRDLIFSLMCHFELNIKAFEKKWSIHFFDKFNKELESLSSFVDDNCLEITDHFLRVTQRGYLIIRNIVMVFDAYVVGLQKSGSKFSRTL